MKGQIKDRKPILNKIGTQLEAIKVAREVDNKNYEDKAVKLWESKRRILKKGPAPTPVELAIKYYGSREYNWLNMYPSSAYSKSENLLLVMQRKLNKLEAGVVVTLEDEEVNVLTRNFLN